MLWSNLAINGVRKCSNNGEKEDHLAREMGRYSGNFRGFSSDCFYFLWEISKKWYRVWGRKWWRFGERGEDVKQSFRIMEK